MTATSSRNPAPMLDLARQRAGVSEVEFVQADAQTDPPRRTVRRCDQPLRHHVDATHLLLVVASVVVLAGVVWVANSRPYHLSGRRTDALRHLEGDS